MASGLVEGGREGARRKLEKFWRRMSAASSFLPLTAIPAGFANETFAETRARVRNADLAFGAS